MADHECSSYKSLIFLAGICALTYSCNINAQSGTTFQELPAWIFDRTSIENPDSLIAIGISDPGLDRDVAFDQAKLRAAAMLSLKSGFHFSKMNEAYNEHDGEMTSSMQSSIATLSSVFDTACLNIIETGFSDYDECFILAAISKESITSDDPEFSLEINLYQALYDILYPINYGILNFNITSNKSDRSFNYKKYLIARKEEVISTIDSVQVQYVKKRYKYVASTDKPMEDDQYTVTAYIGHTMWDAYVNAVLTTIAFAFNSDSAFSTMTETNFSEVKQISQVTVDRLYVVDYRILSFYNSNLYMKISIENTK